MQMLKTKIQGVYIIEPSVFQDSRGYFKETFRQDLFKEEIEDVTFVQDNESKSGKNVLRGLHFQKPPYSQGKLVGVIKGAVLDVVVDLRKDSPTYGLHHSEILSEANHKLLYLPEGMAHGFVSLEDETIFSYKCTDYYHPESEGCILYNDPSLNIDWGGDDFEVSSKDKNGIPFKDFVSPF